MSNWSSSSQNHCPSDEAERRARLRSSGVTSPRDIESSSNAADAAGVGAVRRLQQYQSTDVQRMFP